MLRGLYSHILRMYMILAVFDLNIYTAYASLGSHKVV